MQNANECVNELVKHLKDKGFTINKDYQQKQKPNLIVQSKAKFQSNSTVHNNFQHNASAPIDKIKLMVDKIEQYEKQIAIQPSSQTIQYLIMLYNKAVEYFSALNDERHHEYLEKLQKLFQDKNI